MGTSAPQPAAAGSRDRRRAVEARLALVHAVGSPASRRTPPPEGRLGADDYPIPRLCEALADLGPVFATFGRYLGSRLDLVSRRDAALLSAIPDSLVVEPLTMAEVQASVGRQLGTPLERRFFSFEFRPRLATTWVQRHDAWLAPGVPVLVTLVRPDAHGWLAADLPMLSLVLPYIDAPREACEAAIDDFILTLRRRLDQTHQAAAFATLAADASANGGFDAPVVYRDHTAPGILTVERPTGVLLRDVLADAPGSMPDGMTGEDQARRVTAAWLRHALSGRLVPFDFGETDILVSGDRIVLVSGAFEPHSTADRARFLTYLNAAASDDPDTAASWIVDAGAPEGLDRREEELRRRLRQAVPFRDGEWSGDDRLAEHVLVQWRMATQAGWPLTAHHLHVYRGIQAATVLALRIVPYGDALAGALRDERLQIGLAEAKQMIDPRAVGATLDRLLQDMVHLPQKLDDVLTLAAEGRLRLKLNVPDGDGAQHTRNRTVLLVAILVALTGLASVARHFAPALGAVAERLAAVAVLMLGGWLLVAAARM
jgi:predicted unusual protein kinase regulating ubiquinone biosynthesis (AarF/ABC1/UbiB family)